MCREHQKAEGWENDTGKGMQLSKGCVTKSATTVGNGSLIPQGNYEKLCRILASGPSYTRVRELHLPRVVN